MRRPPLLALVVVLAAVAAMIGLGLVWAVILALLGGLLPSMQAARLPIVDALRATENMRVR